MPAFRILIVYGTSYGQTAKIARHIGDTLTSLGHHVTLVDARNQPAGLSLEAFDGIILGASIIAGGHQKSVVALIHAHRDTLNRLPSAFYSVSASAGSIFAESRAAAEQLRDEFLAAVAWQPALRASIAGAVNYPRYSFFLRWYMKRASAKNGGMTDTSREYEYTNWRQVEDFAWRFASMLAARDREAAAPVPAHPV